ncbi:MAG TPA: SdrD B-like domain-containing protein, partial [Nitrospiria bacterium]|nr:SdrD B-like domain-containing protein [Nitrospiria bacterium]
MVREPHGVGFLIYVFPFLIALLFLPTTGWAVEEGHADFFLEYQTRTNKSQTSTSSFKTSPYELKIQGDLYQETGLWGTAVGTLNILQTDDGLKGGRTFLGLGDLSLYNRFTLDTALGDTGFQLTSMVDNDIRRSTLFRNLLPGLRPEYPLPRFTSFVHGNVFLRGLRTDINTSRGYISVLAGRVMRLGGLTGSLYSGTGAMLGGVRGSGQINPRLRMGGGLIHVNDTPLFPETTRVNNTLLLYETIFQKTRDLSFLFYSQASIHGETENAPSPGLLLRFGPVYETEKFRVEANYRRIEPGYLFADPAQQPERDQEGFFTATRLTPRPRTSLFGSMDIMRTNLDDLPSITKSSRYNIIIGGTQSFRPAANLTTSINYGGFNGSLNGQSFTGKNFRYNLSGGIRRGRWEPFGRYRWEINNDSRISSRNIQELTAGIRGYPRTGFYLQSEIGGRFESRDTVFILRERFTFIPRFFPLNTTLDTEFSFHNPDDPTGTEQSRRIGWSVFANLPHRTRIQIQVSETENKTAFGKSNTLQVGVKLSTRTGWGTMRQIVGGGRGEGFGIVQGTVFLDTNLNGIQDQDEQGIPEIYLKIDDRSVVKTDSKGRYFLYKVVPGEHELKLVPRNIPADLNVKDGGPARVTVSAGQKQTQDFTVVKGSLVNGMVIDMNTGGGIPNIL